MLLLILPAGFAPAQDILPFEPNDTLEEIRYKIDHNGYSFEVSDNWVFDMSSEEKSRFFSRHAPAFSRMLTADTGIGPLESRLGTVDLPAAFDWRNHEGHTYIGAVRDQGSCGSCYAFGACAAAEGTYNWATGNFDNNCADFSESYIIWCLGRLPAYSSDFFGCGGASYAYMELEALTVKGVGNESDFPYQESDPGSCTHWSDQTTVFQSWHRVPCNDIDAIKTVIMTYGVVDAAVYVGSAFEGYAHGIYEDTNTTCDGSPCSYTTTNHAIALVGWDDDPPEGGGGVWILRNSWGTSWGESGYMRIRYTSAATSCAVCYLVYQSPATPTPTPIGYSTPTPTPSTTPTPAGFRTASPTPTQIATSTPTPYSILFSEDFEDAWSDGTPIGWTKEYIMGTNNWTQWIGGEEGNPASAHGGSYNALFYYENIYYDDIVTRLISPRLEFGTQIYNPRLSFWLAMEEWFGDQDELSVYYRTSAGGEWNLLTHYDASITAWTEQLIDLPEPGDDYYICFEGTANYGHGICVDDLSITVIDTVSPTPIMTPPATATPTPTPFATPPATPPRTPTPLPPPPATSTPTPFAPPPATPPLTPTPLPPPPATSTPSPGSPGTPTPTPESITPTPVQPVLTPTPQPTPSSHGPTPWPTLFVTPSTTPTPTPTPQPTATGPILTPQPTASPSPSTTPLPTPHSPLPILDFNGDGTSDIAIFRKDSGLWAVRGITRIYFGSWWDIPVPCDYNGDGTTDVGIFRDHSGLWALRGVSRIYFGTYDDTPLPGDYSGDGTWEPAIFRESSGLWAIRGVTRTYYGRFGDTPSPGYYTGEKAESIGIFRGTNGLWALKESSRVYFGSYPDEVVPGNYSGTGIWSVGIYRPETGLWALRGVTRAYFGRYNDWTVPADYNGDGRDDITIFRQSSGLWAIKGITRAYFGSGNDMPVIR